MIFNSDQKAETSEPDYFFLFTKPAGLRGVVVSFPLRNLGRRLGQLARIDVGFPPVCNLFVGMRNDVGWSLLKTPSGLI